MTTDLANLYERDLLKLRNEIGSFEKEENIWKALPGVANSTGTICLHLCGNIQHFVGHILGKSDYVRDREFEFSGQPVPKNKLINEVDASIESIKGVIPNLTNEDLNAQYPVDIFKDNSTTERMILHLYGHLSWHLGQINYLRRILESKD